MGVAFLVHFRVSRRRSAYELMGSSYPGTLANVNVLVINEKSEAMHEVENAALVFPDSRFFTFTDWALSNMPLPFFTS